MTGPHAWKKTYVTSTLFWPAFLNSSEYFSTMTKWLTRCQIYGNIPGNVFGRHSNWASLHTLQKSKRFSSDKKKFVKLIDSWIYKARDKIDINPLQNIIRPVQWPDLGMGKSNPDSIGIDKTRVRFFRFQWESTRIRQNKFALAPPTPRCIYCCMSERCIHVLAQSRLRDTAVSLVGHCHWPCHFLFLDAGGQG